MEEKVSELSIVKSKSIDEEIIRLETAVSTLKEYQGTYTAEQLSKDITLLKNVSTIQNLFNPSLKEIVFKEKKARELARKLITGEMQ